MGTNAAPDTATPDLTFEPLIPERWDDLARLFGPDGAYEGCWCMEPRLPEGEFARLTPDQRQDALRALVGAGARPGLVGYAGGEPVAWCSVGPLAAHSGYLGLREGATPAPDGTWSIVCFFVAAPYRGRGVMAQALRAAAEFAAAHGATCLEGYPVGGEGTNFAGCHGYTGVASTFEGAGFGAIRPPSEAGGTTPRAVMRLRLAQATPG